MHSCIYEGFVTHRRYQPIVHEFRYRLFMVYLDLDEIPELVGRKRLIANRKRSTRAFLRSDHLFNAQVPLTEEVRQIAKEQTGRTSTGPIRMLTQLRYFGYYFSPLNLFYLFDSTGEYVEAIVAEVSNTPWKERHCYVLWDGIADSDRSVPQSRKSEHSESAVDSMRFSHQKQFHVSPFMDMDLTYLWSVSPPGDSLNVQLQNFKRSEKMFAAAMHLNRREISQYHLRRMALRFPHMTAQISWSIYYQALKLWWKKCPFYPHPEAQLVSSQDQTGANHKRSNQQQSHKSA